MKLCFGLSGLRLFYVGNVVQNRRSALSFCLARMVFMQRQRMKVYWCGLALSLDSKMKISRRHLADYVKTVPHEQHDYFSSFNQSNHSFVALSLPFLSSFLKLPIVCLVE